MNSKVFIIVFIAACLLLLLSVGGSYWDGSIELIMRGEAWKFLETSLTFWLVISQSGVLLSVFLLIMNVKIHRRTALLLELSSLCSLVVVFFYSLLCMKTVSINSNAYGIGILGFNSLLFFVTHLVAADSAEDLSLCKELARIRKPLAWIMLPTVFWVVSALSLNYVRVENPMWLGPFFPLFVVSCVFYSGLALLVALLTFENYYNPLMGKLLLLSSWFMALLFLWMYFLKGDVSIVSLVLACVVPQLLFIGFIRENLWCRWFVSVCILSGILLKFDFVINSNDAHLFLNLCFADAMLLFAGIVIFVALFWSVRFLLARFFENDEILMGEVNEDSEDELLEEKKYYPPFSAPEFKVVRLPVLCGVLVGVAYGYWTSDWINLAEPIAAYVSCVLVCLQPFLYLGFFRKRRRGGK